MNLTVQDHLVNRGADAKIVPTRVLAVWVAFCAGKEMLGRSYALRRPGRVLPSSAGKGAEGRPLHTKANTAQRACSASIAPLYSITRRPGASPLPRAAGLPRRCRSGQSLDRLQNRGPACDDSATINGNDGIAAGQLGQLNRHQTDGAQAETAMESRCAHIAIS